MKMFFATIGLLALAAAAPAAAAAKAPIEGRWKSGEMEIQIAPCGQALCGTVVKASPKQRADAERGSGTALIGARLISNIHRTGPDTYQGNVFVADLNVDANGTIRQVSPDRLAVEGCALFVICKSETWQRVR